MGQDQLATAERHKPETFSGSLLVPDFFRIESGWMIFRQALGQFTNQRGLADSRQSGNQNVGSMTSVLQTVHGHREAAAMCSVCPESVRSCHCELRKDNL